MKLLYVVNGNIQYMISFGTVDKYEDRIGFNSDTEQNLTMFIF